MINRFEASARAMAAFSTLCHPPYGLPNAGSSFFFVGSLFCASKMMLELGNRIPRITWARFPNTLAVGFAPAGAAAGLAVAGAAGLACAPAAGLACAAAGLA